MAIQGRLLHLHLQVQLPVGQAHEEPQLQVHPGPEKSIKAPESQKTGIDAHDYTYPF